METKNTLGRDGMSLGVEKHLCIECWNWYPRVLEGHICSEECRISFEEKFDAIFEPKRKSHVEP